MDTVSILLFLAMAAGVLELLDLRRRGFAANRGHFVLVAGDLVLCAVAIRAQAWHSWQAWVGIAGALVVIGVPLVCDVIARRALAAERVDVAARAFAVKEIVAPGRAAATQHEIFRDLARVRAGEADAVLHALRKRLVDSEGAEAAGLQERIVTTLVQAKRWRDAVTAYESHAGREHPARHPGLALQILRAYGELGEIERAGQVVHRLEQAAVRRDPGAQAVLLDARLLFVAYAGETELVEAMLATPLGARLGPTLRKAVVQATQVGARHHQGAPPSDAIVETMTVAEATRRSALETAHRVGERLLADLRAAPPPPRRHFPATVSLIAVNLGVHAALVWWRHFSDGYDLVRAGASFHAAVRAGEIWRLATAMFLHDPSNAWHVSLNMLTLWVFGRHVEPLVGTARFLALYAVAGIAGNVASLFLGGHDPLAAVSLGASGAIMGLVGTLIVTLALRRGVWPEPWRRTLLVNLIVLTGLQLAFGLYEPHIDNWAHIGGGLGGALFALLLVPGGIVGARRAGTAIVAVLLVAAGAFFGWSTWCAARARVPVTLGKFATETMRVGPVTVRAPAYVARVAAQDEADWPGEEQLVDPVAEMAIAPHVVEADAVAKALASCRDRDRDTEARRTGGEVQLEPSTPPAMPGWQALGQRPPGDDPGVDYLYYGRAVDGKHVLVVEVGMPASARHRDWRVAELESLLSSIELEK